MGRLQVLAFAAAAGLLMAGASARAANVDGTVNPGEYASQYTGGGTGFGGTLGNGKIFLDSDASKLYVGFTPAGNVDNNVVLFLDTRAGGFTDAQMSDTQDGGRGAVSNLSRDSDDTFPAGVLPDFALVMGGFGNAAFELASGGNGSLIFKPTTNVGSGNNARETAFNLSDLGLSPGSTLKFFTAYVSDTQFLSNESIPADPALNAGGNPGFGSAATPVVHATSATFTVVPEPASVGLLGIGLGALVFRRRRA